jgi:transcriptional regulator with XRE-family HTH domain
MSLMTARDPQAAEEGQTPLRDIVRARKEALGLGYERIAQRCIDPRTGEQVIKSSWLHRLATDEPVQPPTYPMLRGLAAGLDVDVSVLQDASSAEFFGTQRVSADGAAGGVGQAYLEDADRLTPEQRAAVQELIRSLARSNDQ